MNFWNIQLHPNDLGWKKEEELLRKYKMIGLGEWEEAASQQPSFINAMKIGDIVLVKRGGTIIALVKVVSDYIYEKETNELLWFQRRRKIEVLDWYKPEYNFSVQPRKSLERCANPNTNTYISINKWLKLLDKMNKINILIKILYNNKNLILTGAPGTGKTYLAKQIAAQMIMNEIYNEKMEDEPLFKSHVSFTQFHPSYDYTDFVEGLRPKKEANGFVRTDGTLKSFCKEAIMNNDGKPYIFIIDEVNRGEISKIFGELFFSVDPGYRGKTGKVKTQYQNMIDINSNDPFREGFYVPENVYIIGTMNDIDRSVESMDFAFRRRFAFVEIKAEDNTSMLDTLDENTKNEVLNRMKHLNYIIWHKEQENEPQELKSIDGLSSAYHIGACYFLKLKHYNNNFDNLWTYHLEGVLREYLRGTEEIEENIDRLMKAYNDGSDIDYRQS